MILTILLAASLCGAPAQDGKSWTAKDVPHEPGALYALSWQATPRGKGLLNGGPPGFNMDFPVEEGKTSERMCAVVYMAESASFGLRLGTWNMPEGASWRNVSSRRVRADFNKLPSGIVLGAGEAIDGNVYRFRRRASSIQGAHVRPFVKRTGGSFNSGSWRIYRGTGCDYEFNVGGRRFTDFSVAVSCHLSTGSVVVSVSPDGAVWRDIAICSGRNEVSAAVPRDILPTERVYVRLRGGNVCSGTVGYPFVTARIDGAPLRAAGFTRYVDAETGELVGEVAAPDYYDESWGKTIDVAAPGFSLWRADEEMRVAPWRSLPTDKTRGLAVSAAANEAESVQLVVKAGRREVRGVKVRIHGDLHAKGGASIPASAVDVRQVAYLDIRHPTDETCAPGLCPEPLEPMPTDGVSVPPGENRPLWVRVKVPKGTPAGRYIGSLVVSSSGAEEVHVPFGVEVFGFELPDVMTLRTSFGFSPDRIYKYHRVKSPEDRRAVRTAYLKALSEAHVSPYNPVAGEVPHWSCSLKSEDGKEAEFVFKWKEWDEAIARVLRTYHFNSFIFHIPGFTRLDFKEGSPHVFHGRVEGTPEYEALASKYLRAIEAHLRERGWLEMSAVYWIDEPEERHYPLIRRGLGAIRKYAPEIRCRVTEQPERALMDVVRLWCPVSKNLHSAAEAECRARGDEFWWYVCMLPKAPYATEFIDHPGTDMRVWLWQTWQEKMSGILIWEVAYWTSRTVYPDSLQNPYEDAASWSEMGPPGPKTFRYNWGNGDGRFLYPPRACFSGGDGPVLDAPNGSVRLEVLRDGIEDYEYFAILSRLDPSNALLTVPAEVSETLTRFTNRPEPIKLHRRRLAKEIERRVRPMQ